MPVKRRSPKHRWARLDDLAEWELAFIEERENQETRRQGGFAHFALDYGPAMWCRRELIARCLALWEARNECRARDGLPPVWPPETAGLRTLDPNIPFKSTRAADGRYLGECDDDG